MRPHLARLQNFTRVSLAKSQASDTRAMSTLRHPGNGTTAETVKSGVPSGCRGGEGRTGRAQRTLRAVCVFCKVISGAHVSLHVCPNPENGHPRRKIRMETMDFNNNAPVLAPRL